jgi:hypothetical protein
MTGRAVRAECPAAASPEYFLPADTFEFGWQRDWTSRILRTMRVPSLSCGNVEFSESYRLIAIHVFDSPLAVVATLENSVWSVQGVRLGNTDQLTPTMDKTRTLSKDEATALEQVIQESRLWETPEPVEPIPEYIDDGGSVTIEGRRGGSYQVVRRFNYAEPEIQKFATALLGFTGLPDSPITEFLSTLRPRAKGTVFPDAADPPQPH